MKSNIWYDESCKKLLANKSILYNILKRVLPEYQNLSFEEMMPLFSDITDSYTLESRNTEDSFVPNESIHYDVLLYCRLPLSNEGIIVNLEVQANMPAYSILKRGFYYLGRLIARQKGHEYGVKKSEYNHLKKVISIWICNTPKHLKGMLNKYSIDEQNMTLPYSFSKTNYDLMQLIVISPETKPSHQHGIIDFLSLLFGENLDFTSSLQRLENEYGVILEKQEKEEMHKIYAHDFSDKPHLERQRDIFIFQCCIGCRVGDLVRLSKNDIINGTLEYIASKTIEENQKTIVVPLNKTALAILEKYKDHEGPTLLPFITQPKYNDAIKIIFKEAGITRNVTYLNPLTEKEEKVPINTIASSHMARRTFVGNLYKQVLDPNIVASMSGHAENSRAFSRYREIDKEIKTNAVNLLD